MRLLVTGASGLFGSKLVQLALENQHTVFSGCNEHLISCGSLLELNIANVNSVDVAFKTAAPEVVVHAAALTDVDKCELNRELAWKINVEGTINVAKAAKEVGAFMLFISTDYVFDGEKGFYTEQDLPSPISYYGYTKLKAEEHVKKLVDDCCIARPSVIFGSTPASGKVNFALWLLDKLKREEPVKIVTDQWNSPTLNTSLAQMALEVADRRLSGIYHLSGASRISRYDYAKLLAQIFGLDERLIMPTVSAKFSQSAKRPRDSSLNTSKVQKKLQTKPLEITAALTLLKTEIASGP